MNIFYAPPEQIRENVIELEGQEAIHASKALRYQQGDEITVVDGVGGWYTGKVQTITSRHVQIAINKKERKEALPPDIIVAVGLIKKRDRLEFAVEKAVELGVQEIALFRGRHTVKQNIRRDRLQSVALSAMKQSLQSMLPKIYFFNSLSEVLQAHANCRIWAAHEKETHTLDADHLDVSQSHLLIVGPEGGLSDEEIELVEKREGRLVSLGINRLRTETAVVSFLSIFRQHAAQ